MISPRIISVRISDQFFFSTSQSARSSARSHFPNLYCKRKIRFFFGEQFKDLAFYPKGHQANAQHDRQHDIYVVYASYLYSSRSFVIGDMEKKWASTRSTRTAHTFGAFDVDQINIILCVCVCVRWTRPNLEECERERAAATAPPRRHDEE